MNDYDPATNTFTWEAGSVEIVHARKANVGTLTSPTVELYKQGGAETNIASTYMNTVNATVSQNGDTVTITTGQFLSTLPSGTYKIRFLGTLSGVAQVIHVSKLIVVKKSAI